MRLFPLSGKLVTGGSVMDRTSERVARKPEFVHPQMAESLRGTKYKSNTSANASRAELSSAKLLGSGPTPGIAPR
jgi:hypothetical protein